MPNLVGIGNSQAPTNAMLGGLAYQDSVGEITIDKIKARTSDTATDVFVYDTSKDSDGGAWRKKATKQSWYNEGASQKRGSRKEFPAVAVIVAEAREVTIYDGDDPNLSMWMIFDAGETTNYGKALQFWGTSTSGTVSSVCMLNGQMVVGTDNGSDNGIYVGMSKVDFLNDSMEFRRTFSNQYIKHALPISGRNEIQYGGTSLTGGLAGGDVTDVTMTVLPNAPIDESTGLPVPTIIVATDSGISVVRDSGVVYDMLVSVNSGLNYETNSIEITKDLKIIHNWDDRVSSGYSYISIIPLSLFESDSSYGYEYQFRNEGVYSYNVGGGSLDLFNSTSTFFVDAVPTELGYFAIGSNKGLVNIQHKPQALNNGGRSSLNDARFNGGMQCRITNNFNTGWLFNNIRGAFLSDTDDTNATEVVNNHNFNGGITGWTIDLAGASGGSPGITVVSNKLRFQQGSSNSVWLSAYQDITTVVGKKYLLNIDIASSNTSANWRIYAAGTKILGYPSYLNQGQHSATFVATSTSSRILIQQGGSASTVGEVNSISVQLVENDRSVNDNYLEVSGTIQKNPVATGAELVAYSGFTSGNYLQMTSGVLGVNTSTDGPLTVMCWYKGTTTNAAQSLVIIGPASNHQGRGLLIKSNTGELGFFRWSNDPYSSRVVADDSWHHCVATVESGSRVKLYVDGDLVYNQSITLVTSSSTQVRIGYSNGNNAPLVNGSLALVRISNSVASSDQIKKIYNDEKCLYHENAKCTLHGTADAITAIAYDDTNDILHAGTSSGRSEFQGLVRINNTTTAVTTSISASNRFVAEK